MAAGKNGKFEGFFYFYPEDHWLKTGTSTRPEGRPRPRDLDGGTAEPRSSCCRAKQLPRGEMAEQGRPMDDPGFLLFTGSAAIHAAGSCIPGEMKGRGKYLLTRK